MIASKKEEIGSQAEIVKKEASLMPEEACRLAAGLIIGDRLLLLPLIVILAGPSLLTLEWTWFDSLVRPISAVCEGLIIYLVGIRAIARLRNQPPQFKIPQFAQITLWSLGLWLLMQVAERVPVTEASAMIGVSVILLLASIYIQLQYIFFSIPILFNVEGLGAVATRARAFSRGSNLLGLNLLPLRVILPAYTAGFLLSTIVRAPFVGQQALYLNSIGIFCYALSGVLASYLTVAFGITYLQDKLPQESWLNRSPSADTALQLASVPPWVGKGLSLRQGFFMLGIALVVYFANHLRALDVPPTAKVTVESIALRPQEIVLQLTVEDSTDRLEQFQPLWLNLAAENKDSFGSIIGTPMTLGTKVELSPNSYRLTLPFHTKRDVAGLKEVKDLHLWHGNVKLHRLEMEKAVLEATTEKRPDETK